MVSKSNFDCLGDVLAEAKTVDSKCLSCKCWIWRGQIPELPPQRISVTCFLNKSPSVQIPLPIHRFIAIGRDFKQGMLKRAVCSHWA